jgi:hypothetical protein
MHRLTSAFALLLGGAVACGLAACTAAPPGNGNAANANASPASSPGAHGGLGVAAPAGTPCPPYPVPSPPAFVDASLSRCIPHEPVFSGDAFSGGGQIGMGAATAQPFFDVFSWRSFIALNWPTNGAGAIGQAGGPNGPDGDAPTVWEGYNESYQVFLEDGSQPHWGPPANVPAACQNPDPKLPVFRMLGKVSDQVAGFNQPNGGTVLDERGQPFRTGPLIDPRGQYVRFAIHLNRETFDYIVANKLYNKEGQAAFAGPVNMPIGADPTPTPAPGPGGNSNGQPGPPSPPPSVGSIVIKSAWRILDPAQGDKPERYHKIKALVYNAPSDDPPVQAQCSAQTLGLIGFHIMHKVEGAPQWIWSTFEQVDNVRADGQAGVAATFFDPKHPERKINQPPDKPWNPTVPATPSQLARLNPIDTPTQNLNQQWQNLLRTANPNSVWQFYQLISTQWPTNPGGDGFGAPAPPVLANITLETYTQRSSSCIACHKNATTTNGKFGDFSYLLQRAQPEKKP